MEEKVGSCHFHADAHLSCALYRQSWRQVVSQMQNFYRRNRGKNRTATKKCLQGTRSSHATFLLAFLTSYLIYFRRLLQDERPSSARGGGWGGRGRSGECASSDTVEVKILQRSMEKVAITHPSSPAVVQTVDAPVSAGGARHGQGAHGAGGGGKGAKASTPRHDDIQHASSTAPVIRGHPHSPKLDAAAAVDATGRAKGPPKSPNLGPAAASVVTAAAAAADGTPSNRGKGKRKESGGKGKPPQGTGDLPLPFDS